MLVNLIDVRVRSSMTAVHVLTINGQSCLDLRQYMEILTKIVGATPQVQCGICTRMLYSVVSSPITSTCTYECLHIKSSSV